MNLSKFPTITKCKTVILPIYPADFGSQTFFPYDAELDNSILKGIRIEYINTPFSGTIPPYSIIANLNNVIPLGVTGTMLRIPLAIYFGITLVDKNNNNILQDYPVCALTQPRLFQKTNYIRRFNARINLQKSFISVLDKTVIPTNLAGIDALYSAFTFYYKPIK